MERILVHFDVDVTDTPAVDVAHPGELPLDDAARVLEIALASPGCAGLVFAECNPRLDAGGSFGRRLTDRLVEALGAARAP